MADGGHAAIRPRRPSIGARGRFLASARARLATLVAALAIVVAGTFWPHPELRAETKPETCPPWSASNAADPVGRYDLFGLHLDMKRCQVESVLKSICADGKECWETIADYRQNERIKTCRETFVLRRELRNQWTAQLRVYFTGQGSADDSACNRYGHKPEGVTDTTQYADGAAAAQDTGSTVYRIEWAVYWADKNQWLTSVRDRMRDRVLGNIGAAAPELQRSRTILDHGATHRYEWQGPGQETKLKSYIAFDISYSPQITLVVSRGEHSEIYAPRESALEAAQTGATNDENNLDAVLSNPAGDVPPQLPLPVGITPKAGTP